MEIPNCVRYFQRLNEMVKELAKEFESEKKGEKMPRLIDAEKADRRIEQFLCGGCDDYHNCGNCLAHKALSFLRGEPTVDAEPVRHGHWIYTGFMEVKCSECSETFHELESTNYCPNCGAKMSDEVD